MDLDKSTLMKELSKILEVHPELEQTLYMEFNRRFKVLKLLVKYVEPPARVVEAGASPFILSAMLTLAGFNVIALDVEPTKYLDVAEMFRVKVLKCDLERDSILLPDEFCDAVVMSEVIEHLNPYYVSHALSELNRILKQHGYLVLTTPNIASLFRRLKLLLGLNPVYRYHVREYTLGEILELLKSHGFEVVEAGYDDVNDLSFLNARSQSELRKLPYMGSYMDMLRYVVHSPTLNNILRAIAYPIVKLKKSLRMLIVVVARKVERTSPSRIKRWG